jgi:hypothetical protein
MGGEKGRERKGRIEGLAQQLKESEVVMKKKRGVEDDSFVDWRGVARAANQGQARKAAGKLGQAHSKNSHRELVVQLRVVVGWVCQRSLACQDVIIAQARPSKAGFERPTRCKGGATLQGGYTHTYILVALQATRRGAYRHSALTVAYHFFFSFLDSLNSSSR